MYALARPKLSIVSAAAADTVSSVNGTGLADNELISSEEVSPWGQLPNRISQRPWFTEDTGSDTEAKIISFPAIADVSAGTLFDLREKDDLDELDEMYVNIPTPAACRLFEKAFVIDLRRTPNPAPEILLDDLDFDDVDEDE